MPSLLRAARGPSPQTVVLAACIGALTSPLTAQNANVSVNLNMRHQVGGISTFDRSKFITIHSDHTESDWDNAVRSSPNAVTDLRADFLTGRDVYLGRNTGYVTWYLNNQIAQDPAKPGWAQASSVVTRGLAARNSYEAKTSIHSYESRNQGIMGAQIHPFWPDGTLTNLGWAFSQTDTVSEPFGSATGDYMGRFLNEFYDKGGIQTGPPSPAFVEVINEPDWDLIDNGTTPPADIWKFHNSVADGIRAHNTGSLIGGYTEAFPDPDRNNFQEWDTQWKSFIDTCGTKMDFWSIHLYDFPSINNGKQRYRKGGNIEATLDLIDYYSTTVLGSAKPYVISEYGAQVHDYDNQDWSAYRDWLRLKSITSMVMSFMSRPHLMLKTIPFTVIKAEWGRNTTTQNPYGPRLMRQADEPASYTGNWVYTDLVRFYDLWSSVNGTRVHSISSDPDIQTDAYVSGTKAYVILNNIVAGTRTINLSLFETHGVSVQSVRQKSLSWNGSAVVLDDTITSGNLPQVTIGSEGAVILEYTLSSALLTDQTLTETKKFATTYLQSIQSGTTRTFQINNVATSPYGTTVLRVGIARAHALSKQPTVLFNNTAVNVPTDIMGFEIDDRTQFFGMLEIPVPYNLLQTNNTVSVTFPDTGGTISSVALRSFGSTTNTIATPPASTPDRILIADNFNPRVGQIFPNNGLEGQGGVTNGKIEFRTDGPNNSTLPTTATASPWKVDFKWTGLDLDGTGGTNDIIYFTLVANGSIDDFATLSNIKGDSLGWGVLNVYLDQSQSLRFTIENVSLSAGTGGSAQFDGFTAAKVIKANGTTGSATTGTINGLAFSVAAADTQYSLQGVQFSPVNLVTLKTVAKTTIAVCARDFDLQFSYYSSAPQTGYAAWVSENGLFGTDALAAEDPDHDGVTNLEEYAFGGNPNNSALTGHRPRIQSNASNLEFAHAVRTSALSELSYILQGSPDMLPANWIDSTLTITGTADLGGGFTERTYSIPANSTNRFFRLKIRRD